MGPKANILHLQLDLGFCINEYLPVPYTTGLIPEIGVTRELGNKRRLFGQYEMKKVNKFVGFHGVI